ncbi:ABC transporter substrate-binding protein [Litchfieldia salsa]|uniref:Peptide/nickel transport system substrate-binding protein n=1 Tax=Litchfieldia salsa TaxID=930152 RepID=A0A1H0UBV7_9BACI|nr:peptide/nickel transport system substrate-binding protein [Litchfieldia salsa]
MVTSQYSEGKAPVGTIHIVDPSPLNWLFVLFNTMEEAVGTDREGRIVPALATSTKWVNEKTLELKLREGVLFHNNEPFTAEHVIKAFNEIKPWIAPHPPGTWVNLPEETSLEKVDEFTVQFHFPKPEGLALGKLRAHHYATFQFWDKLGFGYRKLGTAEGHW